MVAKKSGARPWRGMEALLLVIVTAIGVLGFTLLAVGIQVQLKQNPLATVPAALLPALLVGASFAGIHILLRVRRVALEPILLPAVELLLTIGLLMIWRLRGSSGVWQQLLRGFIPGMLLIAALILRPHWIELVRRWAIPISLFGLALPIATALFGVTDETGARLALKLGPLPAIQASEIIKVVLVIFLAWYIEREGREATGRARPLFGWLRLPTLRYLIPGTLFVGLATLALVAMSDFGAVLILGAIFIGMLYAGFETRIFAAIAALGLVLALLMGVVLSFTWQVPTVIQYRFLAFRDPWSSQQIELNGQPSGVTISEGPGYQIQQSVYALIAGGVTGTGLGFGSPEYVPLAQSDFIFAAILEEMGAVVGIAVLILFAILLLRILRIALLLPPQQVFERLLLTGIAIHLFTQVFVMVGGTLNLLPLTGVTIPFLSLGGVALLVNLAEIGVALALAQRLEAEPL